MMVLDVQVVDPHAQRIVYAGKIKFLPNEHFQLLFVNYVVSVIYT